MGILFQISALSVIKRVAIERLEESQKGAKVDDFGKLKTKKIMMDKMIFIFQLLVREH